MDSRSINWITILTSDRPKTDDDGEDINRSHGVALTCVEEQSVWLACSEVQRDGILGTDNGFTARLAHVVRQEFGATERRLGWCLICKWKSMRMLSDHAMAINQTQK